MPARTIGEHKFGARHPGRGAHPILPFAHAIYGLKIAGELIKCGCPFGCNSETGGSKVRGRQKLPTELYELYTEQEWFEWTKRINTVFRSQSRTHD